MLLFTSLYVVVGFVVEAALYVVDVDVDVAVAIHVVVVVVVVKFSL